MAERINLIGGEISKVGLKSSKDDGAQGQIERLERVAQLLEKGVITADDAIAMKEKILAR